MFDPVPATPPEAVKVVFTFGQIVPAIGVIDGAVDAVLNVMLAHALVPHTFVAFE